VTTRLLTTVAGLLVTAGLVYFAVESYDTRNTDTTGVAGGLYLPDFKDKVNETARIRGVNEDGPMTLERDSGLWVVRERGGYPASQAVVSRFLAGLSLLTKLDAKTSKPERYTKIGLDEPGEEGSKARSFFVEDNSGNVTASIIIGDEKPARANPSATEYYVRVPDDPQAWLVEGSLPRTAETVDWLDDALLSLDEKRVRSLTVTHGDGEVLAVERTPGKNDGYALLNIPEDREVENTLLVRNIATGTMSFPFEDVEHGDGKTVPSEPDITITIRNYDGLVITMSGMRKGEDHNSLWFSAHYDAASAEHVAPEGEVAGTGDAEVVRLDAEAVKAEAERLNDSWAPWIFEVGNWRIATADKRIEEFLKKPPAANVKTDG
jgi:hypothetical protein